MLLGNGNMGWTISYSTMGSVTVPAAGSRVMAVGGTYNVGWCVNNQDTDQIAGTHYVSGWVQVTQ